MWFLFMFYVCLYPLEAGGASYTSLGCWADTSDRALGILEGSDPRLDGDYWKRINPIEKCFQVALSRGFTVFGVQDGGECFGSADGHNTYQKYGNSTACKWDGEGGDWANEVYQIIERTTVHPTTRSQTNVTTAPGTTKLTTAPKTTVPTNASGTTRTTNLDAEATRGKTSEDTPSSNTVPVDSSPNEETPVVPIVAGVVSFVVLCVIVAGTVFFLKKCRSSQATKQDVPADSREHTAEEANPGPDPRDSHIYPAIKPQDMDTNFTVITEEPDGPNARPDRRHNNGNILQAPRESDYATPEDLLGTNYENIPLESFYQALNPETMENVNAAYTSLSEIAKKK